uniref:Uncharacterized protein n=1 Tax=Rhizophora mucronata TaxID=61149 RepID=A0A2P2IMD6_RHIMU
MFLAKDWAQPIKCPSSRKIRIDRASLSRSPLAKP